MKYNSLVNKKTSHKPLDNGSGYLLFYKQNIICVSYLYKVNMYKNIPLRSIKLKYDSIILSKALIFITKLFLKDLPFRQCGHKWAPLENDPPKIPVIYRLFDNVPYTIL